MRENNGEIYDTVLKDVHLHHSEPSSGLDATVPSLPTPFFKPNPTVDSAKALQHPLLRNALSTRTQRDMKESHHSFKHLAQSACCFLLAPHVSFSQLQNSSSFFFSSKY